MATLQQKINVAFKEAFGRNATAGELSYYGNKGDAGYQLLVNNLRKDPKAGGNFSQANSQINSLFSKYYGRNATKTELDYYKKYGVSRLESNILADTSSKKIVPTKHGQKLVTNPVNPVSGKPVAPNTPSVNKPVVPEQPKVLSYDEWLRGAGKSYANAYNIANIRAEYDPYYNKRLGGLEQERTLAQQDLTRTSQDYTKSYGETFNEAGLYGSGIYQQELGKTLSDLTRGFEQNYGTGQYTPYSLRKQEVLQQQKEDIAGAELERKNRAFNVYQQQYYPLLANQ